MYMITLYEKDVFKLERVQWQSDLKAIKKFMVINLHKWKQLKSFVHYVARLFPKIDVLCGFLQLITQLGTLAWVPSGPTRDFSLGPKWSNEGLYFGSQIT